MIEVMTIEKVKNYHCSILSGTKKNMVLRDFVHKVNQFRTVTMFL